MFIRVPTYACVQLLTNEINNKEFKCNYYKYTHEHRRTVRTYANLSIISIMVHCMRYILPKFSMILLLFLMILISICLKQSTAAAARETRSIPTSTTNATNNISMNDGDDDDDDSSSEETIEDSNEQTHRRKRRYTENNKSYEDSNGVNGGNSGVSAANVGNAVHAAIPGLPDPATILKIAEILQTVGERVIPVLIEGTNFNPVSNLVADRFSRDYQFLQNFKREIELFTDDIKTK